MSNTDPRERQISLRRLLAAGQNSTQEELADELRRQGFDITQSTISRDLRKIGAIKTVDPSGKTIYKLSSERPLQAPLGSSSLKHLLIDIQHNGSMIVIHTAAGSASLIAAHFDRIKIGGILGTIAGDDTVFVAPLLRPRLPRLFGKSMTRFKFCATNSATTKVNASQPACLPPSDSIKLSVWQKKQQPPRQRRRL
jgi:transcriptional regulator of arginine metabolism